MYLVVVALALEMLHTVVSVCVSFLGAEEMRPTVTK